jgi:hypothetical protein
MSTLSLGIFLLNSTSESKPRRTTVVVNIKFAGQRYRIKVSVKYRAKSMVKKFAFEEMLAFEEPRIPSGLLISFGIIKLFSIDIGRRFDLGHKEKHFARDTALGNHLQLKPEGL